MEANNRMSFSPIQKSLGFKQYSRFSDWVLVVEGSSDINFYKNYTTLNGVYKEEEIYDIEEKSKDCKSKSLIDKFKKIDDEKKYRTREKIVCIVNEKEKNNQHFFGIIDADYHCIDYKKFSAEMNYDENELEELFKTNIKYTDANSLETMMVKYAGPDNFAKVLRKTPYFTNITGPDIQQALDFAYQVGLIRKISDRESNEDDANRLKKIAEQNQIKYSDITVKIKCNKILEKNILDYLNYDNEKQNYIFRRELYISELEQDIVSQYVKVYNLLDKPILRVLQVPLFQKTNEIINKISNTITIPFDKDEAWKIDRGHDVFDFIATMEYKVTNNSELSTFINKMKNDVEKTIINEYVKESYFNNSDIYNWLKEKDRAHKIDFYKNIEIPLRSKTSMYETIYIYLIPYVNGKLKTNSYFILGKSNKKEYISYITNIDENLLLEDDISNWYGILSQKRIYCNAGIEMFCNKNNCLVDNRKKEGVIRYKCFSELNNILDKYRHSEYNSEEKFIDTIEKEIIDFLE